MDLNKVLGAAIDAAENELNLKTGNPVADAVVGSIVEEAAQSLKKDLGVKPVVKKLDPEIIVDAPKAKDNDGLIKRYGKDVVEDCFNFVMKMEGGYVNNPHDRGGATNKGVTQSVYDSYRGRKKLAKQDVRLITVPEALAIFKEGYWKVCGCDELPACTALAVVDFAFNSGSSRALRYLNICTPRPLDYAARHGDETLAMKLIDAREQFFRNIVTANPSQKVFLKGWMNRIAALRAAVHAMNK
jgi:hypothetical protein